MAEWHGVALLSDEDLARECDNQADWLTKSLKDGTHDSWTPHLTVILRDEAGVQSLQMFSLHLPSNSVEDKARAVAWCGRKVSEDVIARRLLVLGIVFTCETWRSTKTDRKPEADPERGEGLLVVAQSCDNRCVISSAEVTRVRGMLRPGAFARHEGQSSLPLLRHFWEALAGSLSRYLARQRPLSPN